MSIKTFDKLKANTLEVFLLLIAVIMLILISYGHFYLVWITMAPMFYLAFSNNHKKIMAYSTLYGLITFIFFFSWINYSEFEFFEVVFVAMFFTLFFVFVLTICSIMSKKIKNDYVILLPPVLWLISLTLYSLLPYQIFWMDFAMFHPSMAPWIWYLGSNGITFVIILFNSILAYSFIKRNKYVFWVGVVIIAMIITSLAYTNYSNFPTKEKKVKVALLQGNFPDEWEWRQYNAFGLILNIYLNMTQQASVEKPDIIVWPEYSLAEDITKSEVVFSKLQETAKELGSTLIVGSLSYVNNKKEIYKDTAFVFDQDSVSVYESSIPYFFDEGVVKGTISDIIETNEHKIGILICNEETTNLVARRHSQKNPHFIVSMSNNQELGRGRLIISQFTKLRAAENAKYLIRATNDGITQIINPLGKVIGSLEEAKRKILIGEIYVNNYKTFYAKYGHILVYLVMVISVILMLKRGKSGRYKEYQ